MESGKTTSDWSRDRLLCLLLFDFWVLALEGLTTLDISLQPTFADLNLGRTWLCLRSDFQIAVVSTIISHFSPLNGYFVGTLVDPMATATSLKHWGGFSVPLLLG